MRTLTLDNPISPRTPQIPKDHSAQSLSPNQNSNKQQYRAPEDKFITAKSENEDYNTPLNELASNED